MFFSIIIPAYNSESSIERCLESVRTQLFSDFEVIIVDDGSTDNTSKYCIEFANLDNRFHYYYQENSGVSAARNFGIEKAMGDFVTFLDSDDTYCPDYLSSFFDTISRYPNSDNYWCGFQFVSDTLEADGRIIRVTNDDSDIVISDRSNIMSLHEMMLDASPVNKAYRSTTLKRNNICMRQDLSLGEDLIFNYEYLNENSNTAIVIINRSLYNYFCFSEESLNHKYRKNLLDIYRILSSEMQRYIEKWGLDETQLIKFNCIKYYLYDSVLRNTFNPKNKEKLSEKIRYNNSIIVMDDFQELLDCAAISVNPVYKKLLKKKNYALIYLVEWLMSIMRKWRK